MDRKKFEELRLKWFDGLQAIADRHPDLFPIGVLSGVLLNVSTVHKNGHPTDYVQVSPAISPVIPEHVSHSILELFRQLFQG